MDNNNKQPPRPNGKQPNRGNNRRGGKPQGSNTSGKPQGQKNGGHKNNNQKPAANGLTVSRGAAIRAQKRSAETAQKLINEYQSAETKKLEKRALKRICL